MAASLEDIVVGAAQVLLLWGAYVGSLNLSIWLIERYFPHKD